MSYQNRKRNGGFRLGCPEQLETREMLSGLSLKAGALLKNAVWMGRPVAAQVASAVPVAQRTCLAQQTLLAAQLTDASNSSATAMAMYRTGTTVNGSRPSSRMRHG